MCFVDLKKAHDSVDREFLWKVLARAGVADEIIVLIHHFHDACRPGCAEGELSRSGSKSHRDCRKDVCCVRC